MEKVKKKVQKSSIKLALVLKQWNVHADKIKNSKIRSSQENTQY